MATNQEMYVHWSWRNFTYEEWREAAKRFFELDSALAKLLLADDAVDHESLEDFQSCSLCDDITELQHYHDEFLVAFGATWAIQAMDAKRMVAFPVEAK